MVLASYASPGTPNGKVAQYSGPTAEWPIFGFKCLREFLGEHGWQSPHRVHAERNRRSQSRVATAVVERKRTLKPLSSDKGEQSLHQLAVWPRHRFEDREMVCPVDWQQMPWQSAPGPRLGVVN